LLQLKGVTYKYKITPVISSSSSITPNLSGNASSPGNGTQNIARDSAYYSSTHIGFLAQDLQKVYPNLVFADKKGVLSIDYNGLIAVLVESIKEQQSVITNLQTSNSNLQTSNANLQTSVNNLQTSNTNLQTLVTSLQASVTALNKKVGIQ
jgi:phage shock protein A